MTAVDIILAYLFVGIVGGLVTCLYVVFDSKKRYPDQHIESLAPILAILMTLCTIGGFFTIPALLFVFLVHASVRD